VSTISKDIQVSLRRLLRDRALTLIAGLTLALGIGLNLVIFGFLDAVILRPLPFDDPARVVHVTLPGPVTYQTYAHDLRRDVGSLSGLLASIPFQQFTLRTDEAVQKVSAEVVSDNYFSVLGVRASAGRLFSESDQANSASVAVVSFPFWRTVLAGDPAIVGKQITLDDNRFTIIGVAAKAFRGVKHLHTTDVWCRIEDPLLSSYRSSRVESLLGRLAPTASPSQVRQEIGTIAHSLKLFDSPQASVEVSRDGELRLGDALFAIVAVCMALPLVVLVMACANISMLVMARSGARTQEIATRLALGGSRWHLVRQLLIETLLLALAAAVLAFAFTSLISRVLPSLIPANLPAMELEARVDWRMVSAAAVLTLAATLLAGLSPAIRATDIDLAAALKTGWDGRRNRRLRLVGRNILITTHIAVSVFFLVVTALLVQGAVDLSQKTLGFSPDRTLVIRMENDLGRHDAASLAEQSQALMAEIRLMPGVKRVSASREVPFDGDGWPAIVGRVPGERSSQERPAAAVSNTVDGQFFDLMGIPVIEGRSFSESDDELAPRVIVVSRKMAEMKWPGRHHQGQQLLIEGRAYEVVGVVGDIEGTLPARIGVAPPPCVYFHTRQSTPAKRMSLSVQLDRDAAVSNPLQSTLVSRGHGIRALSVVSLRRAVEDGLTAERSVALYLSSMGALALLLAATGIYNLISYAASKRMPEIGIRRALGASPGSVVWMMLKQPCWMAIAGTSLGLPAAFLTSLYVGSVFYGMKPPNLLAFGVPPLILAGAVIGAGYFPSRRASKVDPMEALRWG
jgi:putative ABC transport system permease protein